MRVPHGGGRRIEHLVGQDATGGCKIFEHGALDAAAGRR